MQLRRGIGFHVCLIDGADTARPAAFVERNGRALADVKLG